MASESQTTSRADEVRHRRSVREQKSNPAGGSNRSRKRSHTTRRAATPPPVVMRGSLSGYTMAQPRKWSKAKRRYDIALSTPGAEIRLPSLPVIHFGWRLVSAALVAILAFAIYAVSNGSLYRVNAAEIEGLKQISVQDIEAVAGIAGNSIFSIEPDTVREDLRAAFPELSSVSVHVSLPAQVTIKVVERQPVLVWKQGDEKEWVDAAGVAFPVREGSQAPSVVVKADSDPVLTPSADPAGDGDQAKRFLPPQLISAILAMSTRAPQDAPLLYTNEHGLGWKDPRGWSVYFGTEVDDMDMKLRIYDVMVKRLGKKEHKPALISVEYINAPYYRLER